MTNNRCEFLKKIGYTDKASKLISDYIDSVNRTKNIPRELSLIWKDIKAYSMLRPGTESHPVFIVTQKNTSEILGVYKTFEMAIMKLKNSGISGKIEICNIGDDLGRFVHTLYETHQSSDVTPRFLLSLDIEKIFN